MERASRYVMEMVAGSFFIDVQQSHGGPTRRPLAQTFRRLNLARFDMVCYTDMLHVWDFLQKIRTNSTNQ